MPVCLTLYTRPGCHLCEDMEQALLTLTDELKFTVQFIVVEHGTELEKLYGDKVPVLVFDNEVICETFLDKVALTRTITQYAAAEHS